MQSNVPPIARLSHASATGAYYVDGVRCALEPKCAQMLRVLGEHVGQVVSAELLRSEVWGGRPISEGVIPQAMLKLRKALKDDGRLIRNIRHRGYQLTVPIEAVAADLPVPSAKSAEDTQPATPRARQSGLGFALWLPGLVLLALAAFALRSVVPPGASFGSPLAASAPILDAASTHALARQLMTALTPSAMDEAERLFSELARVPDWEAIARADLARMIVLRYEFDGKPYGESLQRAEQALLRADRLAPNADYTVYARAVVREMRGDLPEALALFELADRGNHAIPGFAADFASAALQAGQLRHADALIESGLEDAPNDPRLLLERTWLIQLRAPTESEGALDALMGQVRLQAPGSREMDRVEALQHLQRGQWLGAAAHAQRMHSANAQDSRGLAVATIIALHEGNTDVLPGLLSIYAATDNGRDGRDACLVWEALARAGKLDDGKDLHALVAEVPESLANGLWLRAYAAEAGADRSSALALASRAFELNLQQGKLIDLKLPDFSMHRLGQYQQWLQSAGDTSGLARLRDALAAQQQRLRTEGLHSTWADRLKLPLTQ